MCARTSRILPVALAVRLISLCGASAASLYTETFDSSTAGWIYQGTNASVSLSHNPTNGSGGGALQIAFASLPPGIPALPATEQVVATGSLNTVNFTGDYTAAGAVLIGFDFLASATIPDSFSLFVRSNSQLIYVDLTSRITSTNQWQAFRMSLAGASVGGWVGDMSSFEAIMTNVTSVSFRIRRKGDFSQSYFIDNVFLGRLHAASDAVPGQLNWEHLRVGDRYRVEQAESVGGSAEAWTVITNLVATNPVFSHAISATNTATYYRLMLE